MDFEYDKGQKCAECEKTVLRKGDGQYRCRACINLIFGQNKPLEGRWSRNANQERQAHAKDIAQPFKKDGTVNRDFVKAYGPNTIAKEMKVKPKDILRAVDL